MSIGAVGSTPPHVQHAQTQPTVTPRDEDIDNDSSRVGEVETTDDMTGYTEDGVPSSI